MRGASHARELSGIVATFVLAVAVAALVLRGLNGVPDLVRNLAAGPVPVPAALTERLEYPTLEAAEADLGVKVAIPRYFPSSLTWPPASIRGQREPARVVSLLFRSTDSQQALQIREIFWPAETLPFPIPEPMEVAERQEVEVNGSTGQLLLGRGQGNTEVNQLRWRVDGVHLVVTSVQPAEELLRISRSIHVE